MYKLPETLEEDIAGLGKLAQDYQEGKIETVQFKATRVPMGIYEQRKDEVYMIRVRTTGGVIYPGQFEHLIDTAIRHKSNLLHITTRQEIQIQNLDLSEVEPILYELKDVGLSSKGGGGNTIRNILVDVESGITADEAFDATPYAMALTTKLIAEADSYLLPRKMKIAFSRNEQQADYAAINDVGFIAKVQDGKRGFKVYAGGGAGSKPTIGWVLFDFVPEDGIYIVAEALKKMFSEHGNRKNKHKARLRYIFYKLGEEETLRLIREYYERAKATTPLFALEKDEEEALTEYKPKAIALGDGYEQWKKRYVTSQKQEGYNSIIVPFILGNFWIDNAELVESVKHLLHFVAQFGRDTLRFTTLQNLQVRNIPDAALPELYTVLQDVVADINAPLLANNLISCTGADTCRLGIGLSKGLATAIRRELIHSGLDLDKLAKARIHVSGCPNSCGQQLWADIGFSGKIMRNDRIYPGYQVYIAANREDSPRLAEQVGNINARDIPKFVVKVLADYITYQDKYSSLRAYLENEGKEHVVKLIGEYKEVPSFADDKNYYFDWGAETIFSVIGRGTAECSAGLFDMIDLDLGYINTNRDKLRTEADTVKINSLLYDILYSSSRMLLVTRGAEPKTTADVFNQFIKSFIGFGFVEERFQPIVELARDDKEFDFSSRKDEIYQLADAVIDLYKNMDDSLQFKNAKVELKAEAEKEKELQAEETKVEAAPVESETRKKDLRGVACPMNFVQTKIQLAGMQSGQLLEILLDDGQPIANVPGSVKGEGHDVLEQTLVGDHWKVVIRKK